MKVTHYTAQLYAQQNGLEPMQIDSIPEGFSFKVPDITIGGRLHEGDYIAFIPLTEWGELGHKVTARTEFGLQELYKVATKSHAHA